MSGLEESECFIYWFGLFKASGVLERNTIRSEKVVDLQHAQNHVPVLVRSHHIRLRMHAPHAVGRFNAWIAIRATNLLSSMYFFWFCVLLDISEIALILTGKLPLIALLITILSQTVIQLLALPLLGASQKIISATQDERAEADHETLSALHELNKTQLQLLEVQQKELSLLRKLLTARRQEEAKVGNG